MGVAVTTATAPGNNNTPTPTAGTALPPPLPSPSSLNEPGPDRQGQDRQERSPRPRTSSTATAGGRPSLDHFTCSSNSNHRVSFSRRRASTLFYPLHKRNGIIMTDRDSGFGVEGSQNVVEEVKAGRSFPLVNPTRTIDPSQSQSQSQPQSDHIAQQPRSPKSPRSTRLDPESAAAAPIQPRHHHGVRGADDPTDTNESDLHRPPSIRVISVEAERESQKVRSLYETTEGLNWEDGNGKRPASHDGRLESQVDVPSDGDENDAYGFLEHNPLFIFAFSILTVPPPHLGKTTSDMVRVLGSQLLLRRHPLGATSTFPALSNSPAVSKIGKV